MRGLEEEGLISPRTNSEQGNCSAHPSINSSQSWGWAWPKIAIASLYSWQFLNTFSGNWSSGKPLRKDFERSIQKSYITRLAFVLCPFMCQAQTVDSETGWIGDLWLKTPDLKRFFSPHKNSNYFVFNNFCVNFYRIRFFFKYLA